MTPKDSGVQGWTSLVLFLGFRVLKTISVDSRPHARDASDSTCMSVS